MRVNKTQKKPSLKLSLSETKSLLRKTKFKVSVMIDVSNFTTKNRITTTKNNS